MHQKNIPKHYKTQQTKSKMIKAARNINHIKLLIPKHRNALSKEKTASKKGEKMPSSVSSSESPSFHFSRKGPRLESSFPIKERDKSPRSLDGRDIDVAGAIVPLNNEARRGIMQVYTVGFRVALIILHLRSPQSRPCVPATRRQRRTLRAFRIIVQMGQLRILCKFNCRAVVHD